MNQCLSQALNPFQKSHFLAKPPQMPCYGRVTDDGESDDGGPRCPLSPPLTASIPPPPRMPSRLPPRFSTKQRRRPPLQPPRTSIDLPFTLHSDLMSEPDAAPSAQKQTIGVFGLVSIGFFWVSGGIYGNEELSKTAPSLCAAALVLLLKNCDTLCMYVMLGLIVCPLFYAFPVALMTAELSAALPGDGGFVVWVQKAFSQRLSSHVAWWTAAVFLVDAAVYPVLAAQYNDPPLIQKLFSVQKLTACQVPAAVCRGEGVGGDRLGADQHHGCDDAGQISRL